MPRENDGACPNRGVRRGAAIACVTPRRTRRQDRPCPSCGRHALPRPVTSISQELLLLRSYIKPINIPISQIVISGLYQVARKAKTSEAKVKTFLQIRIQRAEPDTELLGLCAGYEGGVWRADQYAKTLIRNLPQFALPIEKWADFNTATGVEQLARAARSIYTTNKYHNRGEVGELMLFAIMREHYNSEPVVSKFYFKSSANETVHGFDAVHVVSTPAGPELWLGEVKFYTRLSAAMRDVLKELKQHLEVDFLHEEFMWIENKMGDGTSHAAELRKLLDDSTSLDEVFNVMHVPILLTYKSKTVGTHKIVDESYTETIAKELSDHFDTFRAKGLPTNIRVHVLLVPLLGKARLLKAFDERLKALQKL